MNDKVVMILDDEPGVARLCQNILEEVGFDVISLVDSEQGVGVLQSARVDLLLVDIRMPKKDGFQVMEIARKAQPDIAIVIMTGYGTLETATKAMRLGANGLILKPFSENRELIDSVRRALEDREHKKEITRLQTLQPLISITQNLFSETRAEVLIDLILDTVEEHLGCEHIGIYQAVFSDNGLDTGELELIAKKGEPLPGEPIGFGGGPLAQADAWASPIRVNGNVADEQDYQQLILAHGLGTVMCAPMQRGPGGRSVLMAGRQTGEGMFGDADLEMFTILARQASVALENARLYADLRRSLEQVKESQRALIQAEKMAAIGRLTAGIAHEVNNPLQAVRNCLHLVGRQELDEEKRDSYLKLAQEELERLMETMHRALDYYRASPLKRERVQVNTLLKNVCKLLDKQFREANIQLEFNLEEGLPDLFVVRNQMQQVFFNILLNALEAIQVGGTIWIDTMRADELIVVVIEDDGPGVPEENTNSIFEPFMSTKEGGTGLGLSVSYGIIDAHGGVIEILPNKENRRSTGACFRVSLPALEGK
jgi:signal transduction histidine kinase/FixJ family two-component response regulator